MKVLIALLLIAAPSAPPAAKTVATRYAAAVAVVERAAAGTTTQKSQGFFISSNGLLCTVLPGAKAGDEVSIDNDEVRRGVVSVVDEDGLALVDVAGAVDVDALGVSISEKPSTWMVGLSRVKAGNGTAVQGAVGGLEGDTHGRWRLLLPLPRGAPVLDDKNQVVAIAVVSRGGGFIDALPIQRLKALVARLPKS